MNKQELLIELMIVIANMQSAAIDLIDEKDYTNFNEFLEDIFVAIQNTEEVEEIIQVRPKFALYGIVDRERTMQQIGENQALMIFQNEGEENEE